MLDTSSRPREHYMVTVISRSYDDPADAWSLIVLAESTEHAEQIAMVDSFCGKFDDRVNYVLPGLDFFTAFALWEELRYGSKVTDPKSLVQHPNLKEQVTFKILDTTMEDILEEAEDYDEYHCVEQVNRIFMHDGELCTSYETTSLLNCIPQPRKPER